MKKFRFNDERCTEITQEPSELTFVSVLQPMSKDIYQIVYGILNSRTNEEIHGTVTSVLLNLKSPSLQKLMIPKYIDAISLVISEIDKTNVPDNQNYYLYGIYKRTINETKDRFIFALDVLKYYQSSDDALSKESMINLTIREVPSFEQIYIGKKLTQADFIDALKYKREEGVDPMKGYKERMALLNFSDNIEDSKIPSVSNSDEDMKTIGGVVYFLNALDRLPMIAHYAYVRCSADKPWVSKEDNAINSANYKSLYKYCNQPNTFLKSESSAEHIRTILREQFGIKDSAITKVFNDALNKKKNTNKGESK